MILAHDLADCLKWIKKAVSKNESRRNLMNIEFRKTGNKLRILSADAYKIFVEYFEVDPDDPDFCFCAVGDFICEIELYLKLCAGTKKEQLWNPKQVLMGFSENAGLWVSVHGFGSRTVKTIGTEFPNLDNLVNTDSKTNLKDGVICLASDNMKLALSGFETPIFEFRGDVGPCIIREKDITRKAIIMPIKIKW